MCIQEGGFRCKRLGLKLLCGTVDAAWRKLILEGLGRPGKLANYFSCALFCLLSDAASRQHLHGDAAQAGRVVSSLHKAAQKRGLVVSATPCISLHSMTVLCRCMSWEPRFCALCGFWVIVAMLDV